MSFKRKPPKDNERNVRTNGKNIRGVITSKTGRTIQYESFNEFKLILLLERDPNVIDYCSQPEKFDFIDWTGKHHTYIPDFKVWKKDGSIEIHEVTLEKRRVRENMIIREKAGRDICKKRGWKFVLHTEKTLPSGAKLANFSSLYGFKATAYYVEVIAVAVKKYLTNSPLNIPTLITQVSFYTEAPETIVSGCVFHMLWQGSLGIISDTLLFIDGYPNPKSIITLN